MSTDTESTDHATIARHLSDAQAQAESGNFQDALATLKKAKSLEPRNIYILAFEKQVEQLIEFTDMKILTDEQRSDILDSIPGIIERALEPPATEGKASASGEPSVDKRATLEREREEKAAALEWLKDQYFQHAHEYVRKGEYQNALAEIRRVYIIDPANRIAKDFEQQIEQLLSLHKVQTVTKPHFRSTSPAGKSLATAGESSRMPRQGTAPPIKAEASPSAAGAPESETEQATGRRKMSPALTIGIIVALIAAVVALYSYFGGRRDPQKNPTPVNQTVPAPPTGEAFSSAPTETVEQRFVISMSKTEGTLTPLVAREGGESQSGNIALATPGGDTEEAKLISLENPKFPSFTSVAALDGQVVAQVEIDQDGKPVQTKILRSTNEHLDAAVIEAVKNSKFSPRRASGNPVSSTLTIPFTFRQTQ